MSIYAPFGAKKVPFFASSAETGDIHGYRLPKFGPGKADVPARLAFPTAHIKLRKSALAGGGGCWVSLDLV